MANTNTALHTANRNKKDEFYTQLSDIEKELSHYREYFKDKIVLCNCDDPYESNFFKYFALNFNSLGLKKLIATCYDGSPVMGNELLLQFDTLESEPKKIAYKVEITEVEDYNGAFISIKGRYLKEWVGLDCSPNPSGERRILPKRFLYMKKVGLMPHLLLESNTIC